MRWIKQKVREWSPFNLDFLLGNSKSAADPDEKWSNLYREKEKNHLYKWVTTGDGEGELIQHFEQQAEEGVIRFAHEHIAPFLYNDGLETQRIRLSDYAKWKKTVNTNLGTSNIDLVASDLLNEEDIAGKGGFQEHDAQWRLNKRGVEGETVIHMLLNQNSPKTSYIAKLLLREFPGLAKDIYENDEMFGQSSLHLAIVADDYDMAATLVELGAEVNQRATGSFFLPEDQKEGRNKKQTDYIGFAYYGEYPLAFAACFGNKDIFDLLIQHGADPNAQDSFGNTILHMCVINNSIDMYGYAVRHWAKPADVNIKNFADLTPLTLASKLGRKEIFEEMLELMKVEFWRFSDMACSAYPLTALDTINPDGSTNWGSALATIIGGQTPEHMDMIGSEVIQRLLADKWKAYAARKLYERLGLLILHLSTMCFAVYARPADKSLVDFEGGLSVARLIAEIATCLGCAFFILQQQGGEMKTQGFVGYFKNLKTSPAKIFFLIANICIMLCIPCRLAQAYSLEEALLVVALPCSWVFMLFFARGLLLTGPFVQMIYSMIAGDIFRFAIISGIFLVSFSQAFYFLGKDIDDELKSGSCVIPGLTGSYTYSTFPETFVTLFRASMGGYDYEEFFCAHYEWLTKIIFVLYMIIMPIMLINMLIAMMGNTYTTVISRAEKAWRQQWAQIIIVLERAINKEKLARCQTEYSISLSEASNERMEVRGLMVIKQTKKTRAKQRKTAVSNWKRIVRKVIANITQYGGSGQAQEVLHSHSRVDGQLLGESMRNISDRLTPSSAANFLPPPARSRAGSFFKLPGSVTPMRMELLQHMDSFHEDETQPPIEQKLSKPKKSKSPRKPRKPMTKRKTFESTETTTTMLSEEGGRRSQGKKELSGPTDSFEMPNIPHRPIKADTFKSKISSRSQSEESRE